MTLEELAQLGQRPDERNAFKFGKMAEFDRQRRAADDFAMSNPDLARQAERAREAIALREQGEAARLKGDSELAKRFMDQAQEIQNGLDALKSTDKGDTMTAQLETANKTLMDSQKALLEIERAVKSERAYQ
jgi:hypothetical protein